MAGSGHHLLVEATMADTRKVSGTGRARPGDDVAAVVEQDRSGEPMGVRLGANQDDKGRSRQALARFGGDVFDFDPFQPVRAVQFAHHGVIADLDVRPASDAGDQIVRHAFSEVGTADNNGGAMSEVGEPDRCLAGRIAAVDDHHRVPGAGLVSRTLLWSPAWWREVRTTASAPVGDLGLAEGIPVLSGNVPGTVRA
jgi:hypothetical protein